MDRRMIRALALAALLALWTALAGAGTADRPCLTCCSDLGTWSIYPAAIDLVGTRDGVPDPLGTFTVALSMNGWGTLGNVPVTIRIRCPDIKVCSVQPLAGETVTCTASGLETDVTVYTDPLGVATFNIVGASTGLGNPLGCLTAGAQIDVQGCVLPRTLRVSAFDLGGAGGVHGVDPGDLSVWLFDFANVATRGNRVRSDFNHDGVVAANDLSVWLRVFGAGASRSGGPGTYCP